jgi:hypothetical protein
MISNDAARGVKRHHNLKNHLRLTITLLELSITILENIYSTGVTNDDQNILILQATQSRPPCEKRARLVSGLPLLSK